LRADQILRLGRGLELWGRHLARFLGRVCQDPQRPIEVLLAQTFHNPEVSLQGPYSLEDGRKLQITGQYDALLFDSTSHEAILMEFKGLKAGRIDEDFLQLVLYGWLIKAATDITSCGVVFYLEEDEPEVPYSSEDIRRAMQNFSQLFRQVISVMEVVQKRSKSELPPSSDPRLCKECPFDPSCDRDWGPRRIKITTPPDSEVLTDIEPTLEKLNQLVDEMEERYRRFQKGQVPDIHTYKRASPLGHQVVMIDEYADLMMDKDTRAHLETAIQRLGQKGGAAGIHLVLATQRPEARVVTPIIKANLQLKVALKVTSGANSKIILDTSGAEYLVGHGDMLIGGSVPLQRVQGPLVSKTEIERASCKGCHGEGPQVVQGYVPASENPE